MITITVADLREIVADIIDESIEFHRGSRENTEEGYIPPTRPPTEDEVTYFLFSNPLLDLRVIDQLIDPGLIGFAGKTVNVTQDWVNDFQKNVQDWAVTNSWLGADESWLSYVAEWTPTVTDIWIPSDKIRPGWIDMSPSYLLLAADLIRSGKLLSEMNWRDFEKLIGHLLESEGWRVSVTRASRDGGYDVVATKTDNVFGEIKTIWQAKKYGPSNKVKLREVRELSAIREEEKASKALMVTTNSLTRDAIEWVKRDIYRLGYKDREELERWIQDVVFK